ncbi:hypothetical protein ATI61_107599 [Archangium gephyra]|uniref:Lipoprotein n=1 Tax=Archangium gephyra TaxID=48 RepID=A0AAC8QII6_9BACT|nr:hypothetical protein [Archangium gephyra]AKJ08168.1 Hypothetical protein AA314_09794 [Archangium gephyra]REG29902.1 hypothetical protein ATI61_107599 [Archangium gephyra]
MSHVSKLLLLSCLACAFACTVPTIDELEAEADAAGRPYYSCNSDHKCPTGSVCFEERCIRTADLACIPGERVACGTDEGVCKKGSRLCGAEGTYGSCEEEVAPSFEKCDYEDNDCDGRVDRWDAIKLSGSHDLGSSVAAVAVDRASVSKPHALLVVTVEDRSLLIRTRTADGVVSLAQKLSPSGPDVSLLSPVLVADKDVVALAWVERTYVIGSGNPATHSVYLALLNGEGKLTSGAPLRIPYGSTQPDLKRLTIAMNRNAILVLVTTTGPSPAGGPGFVQQLWSVTVARSLQATTLSRAEPMANPSDDFGPHATANGTADSFLVAHDHGGTRRVMSISNGGSLSLSPVALGALDEFTHSPFLVPAEGTRLDFTLYYVRNVGGVDARTSDFSSVTYTADPVLLTSSTLKSHPERIERMRMAVRPGERKPSLALWASREAVSGKRFLYLVGLSPAGLVEDVKPRAVAPDPDFGEEPVIMPDTSRFLFYHHSPSLTAVPAVGGPSELYVQPFCGL